MNPDATTSASPRIVLDDKDFFVVEKPPCYHSVIQPSKDNQSVARWLIEQDSSLKEVGKSEFDGGLLQRLDYETCGLMLGAKNNVAFDTLWRQSQFGKIEKKYLFLCEGDFPGQMDADFYIGSPGRNSNIVRVTESPRKKFRSVETSTSFRKIFHDQKYDVSLVEGTLYQGMRHQIRAVAAYLRYPLIGDTLYSSERSEPKLIKDLFEKCLGLTPSDSEDFLIPSFFLCAYSLSFLHPSKSERLDVAIPVKMEDLKNL